MKNIIALSIITFIGGWSFAQPTFNWANSGGTAGIEGGNSVAFDLNGDVFFALNTTVISSLDEMIIEKRNPAGTIIWTKTFGGASEVQPRSITTDASGNVYICGLFDGTIDFDPGAGTDNHTSNGLDDAFVMMLDGTGAYQWANTFGGVDSESCTEVVIDNNGDIVVTGNYMNTVDFDPGPGVFNLTAAGSVDVFIQKLDNLGNFIWTKSAGGTGFDLGSSLGVNSTNDIIVTGGFQNVVDFDPGAAVFNLTSSGSMDIFVLKLDTNGDFVWAISLGSTSYDVGSSVAISSNNKIHVTGRFAGTVDFDPGVGVQNVTGIGSQNCYALKLNDDGSLNWVQSVSGTGAYASGSGIAIDDNNNVYVTGYFGNTVDFDPGVGTYDLTTGSEAFFALKLDIAGDFTWAIHGGAAVTAGEGVDIAIDPSFNVAIVGSFGGTSDVDPSASVYNLVSNGSYDYFELYLSQPCIPTAPVVDEVALLDLVDECSVSAPTPPTATNCLGTFNGTPDVSFPIITQGTTTVTWTYDDGNGNTSTQTQNAIISDNTAPAADIASLPDYSDECPVDIATIGGAPTATDNCSGAITGSPDVTFPITASGTTNITWTYDDGNGNTSTQTQNVTITPIDNGITQVDAVTLSADASAAAYTYQWVDCDNGNAPINGATNQTFTPTIASSYACIIDNGFCTVTTDCLTSSVGIVENSFGTALVVYPNPTLGNLKIDLGDTYDGTAVKVFNALGQAVIDEPFGSTNEIELNIEGMPGMYILEIKADNGKAAKVSIIKK